MIDSGANDHMAQSSNFFSSYNLFSGKDNAHIVDGSQVYQVRIVDGSQVYL